MRRLALTFLLVIPTAAVAFPAGLVPQADVLALARECALPPVRPGEEVFRVDLLPFTTAAMKDYAADVPFDTVQNDRATYPLRKAVLAAFKTIRETWADTPELPVAKQKKMLLPRKKKEKDAPLNVFLTRVPNPITAALKDEVKAYQVFPAIGLVKLETSLVELELVAELRAKEPKRWQAHYAYAVAQCRARMVFLHEYDLALGYVMREELPDLDAKKGHDGWRMVPSETMKSKRDVKAMAEVAKAAFVKITVDHKGTPWAALATREAAAPPGLRWEPVATK